MSNISQRLSRLDTIAAALPKKHYRPFEGLTAEQLRTLKDLPDAAIDNVMDGVRRAGSPPDRPEYDIQLLQERLDAVNTKEVKG